MPEYHDDEYFQERLDSGVPRAYMHGAIAGAAVLGSAVVLCRLNKQSTTNTVVISTNRVAALLRMTKRLDRLKAACDGSLAQAAAELRWMAEAIVQRRLGSFFARVRPAAHSPPHRAGSSSSNTSSGHADARRLLSRLSRPSVVSCPQTIETLTHTHLTAAEQRRLDAWLHDRTVRHKPLQYVLGSQPFGGLELRVRPPTLIPRWETEEWAARLVDLFRLPAPPPRLRRPLRILELCSGSGCISLLLAHELRAIGLQAQIVAVDIAGPALRLARLNQRLLGIDTAALRFVHGDLFDDGLVATLLSLASDDPADAGFDLIVSNPPYIPPAELAALEPSVLDWEDPRALLASDAQGTRFYTRIEAQLAPALLAERPVTADSGWPALVFEIGSGQAAAVRAQLGPLAWRASLVWQDGAGRDRAVVKFPAG
ncbi:S-adenosyl-L-methionine-dependent methyltransferase [Entophlyctis helioformis]|nr:S-adenosyl-L-methionine-dependent methyltransferase [Entophlyctis helioformis]